MNIPRSLGRLLTCATVVWLMTPVSAAAQSNNPYVYSNNYSGTQGGTLYLSGDNLTCTIQPFGICLLNVSPTVKVGGVNCPVTYESNTQVRCTIPAGAGTNKEVRLNRDGTFSNAVYFDYQPPQITSVSTPSKPTSGGNTVTIQGSRFGPGGNSDYRVEIGNSTCNIITWTNTSIACAAPQGAGNVTLRVSAVFQSDSEPYSYDAPVITSLTPSSGPPVGGIPLQIQGNNFGGSVAGVTRSVQVGSAACQVSIATHTSITCQLPAGTSGASAAVRVTVNGKTSNQVNFAYDPLTCAAGSFSNGTFCMPCSIGRFSSEPNQTFCTNAPPGFFVAITGATAASACPANTFQAFLGQASCAPCPTGFASLPGSAACAPAAGIPPAVTIKAECVMPDPSDATKWLARFGYENHHDSASLLLDLPYGAANNFTVNDTDIGVISGVPTTLQFGIHSNAFTFRFSDTETVAWNVIDPLTNSTVTATPTEVTPSCVFAGPQGDPGAIGPIGPIGPDGPEGPAGADGNDGLPGEPGPPGSDGAVGSAGPAGAAGAQGPQGLTGPMGPTGPTGLTGPAGPQGEGLISGSHLLMPAGAPPPPGYDYVGSFDLFPSGGSRGREALTSIDVYIRR